MNGHPGGIEHTRQMLILSELTPPAKLLDMGAGKGETVQYLCNLGYEAIGIDLNSEITSHNCSADVCTLKTFVLQGDFLHPPFESENFDGIISQCAFYVSGEPAKAFLAAYQLLKPDGILMISDVCPRDITLKSMAETAGFTVLHYEDQTTVWKEYYIEAIWRGTAQCFPCNQKMNYEMLICKK